MSAGDGTKRDTGLLGCLSRSDLFVRRYMLAEVLGAPRAARRPRPLIVAPAPPPAPAPEDPQTRSPDPGRSPEK